jgi:hypothetical protein
MPTHTLTTTQRQEAVLQWLVDQANQTQTPSITVEDYLNQQLTTLLYPFDLKFQEAEADRVKALFAQADPTTQAAIKDLLK